MSRARSLKPGFFKNEELAELPFEFRILFQGLWCLADREGRMEDRPKRIKAEVFPYDNVDVNAGLAALESAQFIQRYEAGGSQYIQVLAFQKHQNPHCKESASTIPAPCSPGASTEISGTSRADSLNPITDSPLSDSLKGKGGKPPMALPDWLPADAWQDWHNYRNAQKGWTRKARELSLRTLTELHAQGHDPRVVIELAIERGWRGLFPIKHPNGGTHATPCKPSLVERAQANAIAAEQRDRSQRHRDASVVGADDGPVRAQVVKHVR